MFVSEHRALLFLKLFYLSIVQRDHSSRCLRNRFRFQSTVTNDAAFPVTFERRVGDALARRRLIKTVFVGDDAHVAKTIKEDERAVFKPVIAVNRLRLCPQAAGTRSSEIYTSFLKYAPDKS